MTREKGWHYPDFVRLFHTSTPLRSEELRMRKESRDLVASAGYLWFEVVMSRTFGGGWRGKSKIKLLFISCEVHHFSRGWQDGGGLSSCGKVLVKHVPATYRASRNWRRHFDSTPWTGRGDKFHHTVSDAWCLDVNSLSTDVYPFVLTTR